MLDARVIVRAAGLTPIVKSAGTVTTSVTLVVCVRVPLVAVMVIGYDPVGVVVAVLMVRVVEPDVVICVGLKLAIAPEGAPLVLKPTVPVNPFNGVMVTL